MMPYKDWCETVERKLDKNEICQFPSDLYENPPLFLIDSEAINLRWFGEPSVKTYDYITSATPASISKWIIWVGRNETEVIEYMLYDIEDYLDNLEINYPNCQEMPEVAYYDHLFIIINNYTGSLTDHHLGRLLIDVDESESNHVDNEWRRRNIIRSNVRNCFKLHDVYSMPYISNIEDNHIDYSDLNEVFKEKLKGIADLIRINSRYSRYVRVDNKLLEFHATNANLIIRSLVEQTNINLHI